MIPLIVNDGPSLRRARPDQAALERVSAGQFRLEPTTSLEHLQSVADTLVAEGVERVGIWGGDGTIAAVVSALGRASVAEGRSLPALAPLPAGTVNGITRCLGIRGRPLRVLGRLAAALRTGRPLVEHVRSPIEVDGRLGFLFGLGLIPNLMEVYDRAQRGGHWTSLKLLATAAGGLLRPGYDQFFAPFSARLSTHGGVWHAGQLTNVSAGAIRSLPYGLEAYLRATERDDAFHLIAHDLDARGALAEMGRLYRGRGMKGVRQDIFEEMRIELERPMPFNLDGDNHPGTESLTLRSGPQVTLLAAPAG